MFTDGELTHTLARFNTYSIDNENDIIYLTSNDTHHLWIIRKIYTPALIVSLYHKRPRDKYYHVQCHNIHSVKQAVNTILQHDKYIMLNSLK